MRLFPFLILSFVVCLGDSVALAQPVRPLQPLRVLYIGPRGAEFVPVLKEYFKQAEGMELPKPTEAVSPEQVAAFDVVLLDWPQSHAQRGAWLDGAPLGNRESWHKPTVLLGSAGLNLAVAWKIHGGSGCTCLAPVAYNLRPSELFKGPLPVDLTGTTNIPTPEQFAPELPGKTNIEVVPLIDGIANYRTVIKSYPPGWSTHYFEFADLPDVEVFSGGINSQSPRSAALWRQGNLLHFGFQPSLAELNAAGRALLVNAVVYISRFTEDRPIDETLSVFGPEKYPATRSRALMYLRTNPQALREVFSMGTLLALDWENPANVQAWFDAARPWLHPNAENLLVVDAEAEALGVTYDSPNFFPKVLAALHEEKTKSAAEAVLARYAPEGPGVEADAAAWDKWWQANAAYLFFSELGGYRWYVDPLAKKRGVPTQDLRGPARADRGK